MNYQDARIQKEDADLKRVLDLAMESARQNPAIARLESIHKMLNDLEALSNKREVLSRLQMEGYFDNEDRAALAALDLEIYSLKNAIRNRIKRAA